MTLILLLFLSEVIGQ